MPTTRQRPCRVRFSGSILYPCSMLVVRTAHNALRADQVPAAFEDATAHVGCPDRRIDRRGIKAPS